MRTRLASRTGVPAIVMILAASLVAATAVDSRSVPTTDATWLRRTAPQLRSADALTFAPNGMLFVGDSRGSAVFALDVPDPGAADTNDVTVQDLDDKIASRLGTTARDLAIHDMAVHPVSHNVYLSVARDRNPATVPVLVRITAKSRIDVLEWAPLRYAKVELQRALSADSATGAAGRNWTISDMAVVDGELFVAGLSNEEFNSTLRRIPIPFGGTVASSGLRMYHTHHKRYETQSPITAFAPYRSGDRRFLIAAYGCTPVVLFPIDSLRDGAKVTGTTVAELGAGSNVRDIVPFRYGDESYVVLAPRRRSLQMLDGNELEAAAKLDENAPTPQSIRGMGSWETWGLRNGNVAQPGVLSLADFDARHLLAIQRNVEDGSLALRPLNKPVLWP